MADGDVTLLRINVNVVIGHAIDNGQVNVETRPFPYDVPGNLEDSITDFVNYYNNRRYHKALGNVTPSDVLDGRREQILQKRKEVQTQTFQLRRLCNQHLRELAQSAPNLH